MSSRPLDLTPYCNAVVATYDGERPRGALNAWGNSFPAEELPFGSILVLKGVPFRLADKSPGQNDNIEPLGQTLEIHGSPQARGIALLGCGEMGDQRVEVRLSNGEGMPDTVFVALARGAMVPAGTPPGDEGIACSHLHYPGDYDLALALPVLWIFEHRWESPQAVTRAELGVNPLFHLLAVTLIEIEGPCEEP